MTLKTRNILSKYMLFLSLLIIVAHVSILIVAIVTESVVPPVTLRVLQFPEAFVPARYSFAATMASIALLALYVPVSLVLLLRFFENTQSVEVIFFGGVLLGCLCESSRSLIPLFGIWQSYSPLLFFASRIVVSGRLMVPLFFFAMATVSDADQRQNVERNFTIVLALSAVIATAMPLNTAQTTSTCMIVEGFAPILTVIRLLLFVITGGAFFINAFRHDSPELKQISVFYIFIVLGYLFLTGADNFLFMGIGTVLLGIGTVQFLRNLHRLYMWK